MALQAAQTALGACHAQGVSVAVSVVDSAGILKVTLADDGVSERGVITSIAKAQAANEFKMPTSALAQKIATDSGLAQRLAANPGYAADAGGLPMFVEGELVGAIGVGGARGKEEACAQAGLERVNARRK